MKVVTHEIYDSARRLPSAIEELVQLFRYRDLAWQLMLRNIKARYKRSALGVLWTMLNPLLIMTVLTLVFSGLFGLRAFNYAIYLLSGLVLWQFFSQVTIASIGEIVWGAGLIKRIYVPRTIFAVAAVGNGLVNLLLSLVLLAIIMLVLRVPLSAAMLILPLTVLLTALFTLGFALLVSSVGVYFADVAEIYQIGLTAWFYLTPIIYPLDIIPERYSWIFKLNPMYHMITVIRTPIYLKILPPLHSIVVATLAATITLVIGWWLFSRSADEIAYRA
jgi:ABC-type polysaccharide/polyol phosphate export permease